jgi:type I restriction enzyme M protein
MTKPNLISKVWNFAHILRDNGVGYSDYLEQITYLLFLKMADEMAKAPYFKVIDFPRIKNIEGKEIEDGEYCNWKTLSQKHGADLESFYTQMLYSLATEKGILGQIFTKAQNKIQDPIKLLKIIGMIDQWTMLEADIKGDIYEELLEKNAANSKSGAGQYFTPRALIKAMLQCIAPQPMKKIHDPCCGTGGFFLAAHNYLSTHYRLDKAQKAFLKNKTFSGNETATSTRRMCLMNLFLHNIGDIDDEALVSSKNALISDKNIRVDYVLANPPFSKKSSMTIINKEDKQQKQDFSATISNKHRNFLQHIHSLLNITGKAAVILPDNALFEGGEGESVRKELMKTTDLHTILRLPAGIFYTQGVKANVLFFDNKPASSQAWTKDIWIYDYRTNVHHTLKKKKMQLVDLQEFIDCYNPNNRHQRTETWSKKTPDCRWRKYTYQDILARDKTNLDIFWLKDKSLVDLDNLPDIDILANEIIEDIEAALADFKTMIGVIEKDSAML